MLRTRGTAAAAVVMLGLVAGAIAQDQKAAMQEKVAALKQSLAANQKALQQYSWIETTEISMKGEVKKVVKKDCRYSSDGKVIKTELAGSQPPAEQADSGGRGRRGRAGGAVKGKVIANKVEDLKEYMAAVAALVKQYVPPDSAKLQAAAQAGKAALNKESAPGVAELAFTDYAVPGDKLGISFNTAAKQIAGVKVNSLLGKDKDPVTLSVRFASLSDGANYPAETILAAPAKQIQVKITNSGHKK